MTPAASPALSCYRIVADINSEHGIHLVQHQETGKFYVRKTLGVYSLAVFQYLAEHPLPGIPRIYETVEEDSRLILIEEYIPGATIHGRRRTPVSGTGGGLYGAIMYGFTFSPQL